MGITLHSSYLLAARIMLLYYPNSYIIFHAHLFWVQSHEDHKINNDS